MKVGDSIVGICDVIKKPPIVAYFIKDWGDWNSKTETTFISTWESYKISLQYPMRMPILFI